MTGAQVHYEVFARRKVSAPWSLQLATEDRARALESAEEMLASGHVAAVRVCKETLDDETREFKSVTLMSKGAVDAGPASKAAPVDETPLCITPQDLYSAHARERIGRLLDGWLKRKSVTAFELLHRADLLEALEASGIEIQHAIQKVAIPEAQARGLGTHEIIRSFQSLVERSVERVLKDDKNRAFPKLTPDTFGAIAVRFAEQDLEWKYLLGGGVAAYLSGARSWSEKVGLILDLADAAPAAEHPRAMALEVLEEPLSEIMCSRGGLADLLGSELDLGGSLAALMRLGAAKEIRMLLAFDPNLEKILPPLTGQAERLAEWLQRDVFSSVRSGLARRVLRELTGPRRLRPSSPDGEIDLLRALAMALTAAASHLQLTEDVQAAFIQRSKALVASDFVETLLAGRDSPLLETQALVRLAENVTGAMNKTAAARWIVAALGALRFERELRYGPETAAHKLAALAALQRGVLKAGLPDKDNQEILSKLGEVGDWVEADAKLCALIGQADAPIAQRLTLLLRLAVGEAAPNGPAADRAKAEVLKLLRVPATRAELANAPDALDRVRVLMTQAGLAA